MNKLTFAGLSLLSLSLFCLALTGVYFTIELSKIREQIPLILQQVEKTSEQIAPVVSEVPQIRQLIEPIIEEVGKTRETIPSILEEVRATRKLVDPVLKEVDLTRQSLNELIPSVVEEVAATRKELPNMLITVDKASAAVQSISEEVGKVRPLVPAVLEEVQKTRDAIPDTLDRTEKIVASAKDLGAEAGKGAVGGVITGIVSAPMNIVGGIFSGKRWAALKGMTDKDIELAREKEAELFKANKTGIVLEWKNPESGYSGTVTLLKIFQEKGRECRRLQHDVWLKAKKVHGETKEGCLQPDGTWIIRDS